MHRQGCLLCALVKGSPLIFWRFKKDRSPRPRSKHIKCYNLCNIKVYFFPKTSLRIPIRASHMINHPFFDFKASSSLSPREPIGFS